MDSYGFTLIEADYINVSAYKTDLKEFFQAMQCRKNPKKLNELFRTEKFLKLKEDTEWAIAVHIDRKKLTVKMEKEGLCMCQAFDELMKDKKAEGKKEGKKEGRKREEKKEEKKNGQGLSGI